MRIESIHWKSSQPLTEDYVHNYDKVSSLFDYNPWDGMSLQERANWLDQERGAAADRFQLAEVLTRYNQAIHNAPEAIQAVEQLKDKRTLCIVGGQQAGLFTGQALVIYKAITLIRSAREASEKLGRPVIPVFWIAGEDHDFDEVNHIQTLTSDLQLHKLKVDHPTGARTSVSRLTISQEQWEEALQQLDASLIPTEFKPIWMEAIRGMTSSSRTLTDLFAQMLAKLFGSQGLVLLDSDDAALRRLEAPMFRTLILQNAELNQTYHQGARQVKELGYTPQVELQESQANLFLFDENGERVLLYTSEHADVFTDRKQERRYTKEQLLEWTETSPERFSNNVLTRPLMQDFLFPVLGTVLGPGEVAYWGLTKPAFHQVCMRMPIVIPRLELTLMEGTVQKNMSKYGLTLEDVIYRLEQKQQEWLKEQDTLQLDARFEQVRSQFKASYQPLVELIAGVNPGLGKLGETNMGKILEQIGFLEQKAADAVKTQFDASLRQFQRIGLSILPGNRPQERVYNIVSYLNKYGSDWLYELLNADFAELAADGRHKVVYM
ncbi:bacillithiol biosynthesis cysteine-adding enzyme BshC [Paenibacillus rigui]|uniref:Putative cysteine ligase BshC n=1 Tax=Paenibacillus rigui TaxID=554312 RepID=A0A229UT38_9BACL|nr:bacillithiol biosynthesis cysteine-adding enzyme BshC [Paenibacillus rigui]OXM86059.1 bacillithiol biosynthesis cysteine-adding enzyme BshC [Paenibacillus rigui]